MKLTPYLLALCALAASATVRADSPPERLMIEVGNGAETARRDTGDLNIILTVGGQYEIEGPHLTVYLARVKAVLITTDGPKVPAMDIEFIPLSVGTRMIGARALPVRITRDIRIDRDLALRVNVAGVWYDTLENKFAPDDHGIVPFARVVADALGYKLAVHASALNPFHGVNVGTLNAEVGFAARASKNFAVRVSLGGSADLSLGASDGFSIQSDLEAYAQVAADCSELLTLYVRGGFRRFTDSGEDFGLGTAQLLGGATFHF